MAGGGEGGATRHERLPRLHLRLDNRVIDSDKACYKYGVHIIWIDSYFLEIYDHHVGENLGMCV